MAARLKDEIEGTTITVLSMGPEQARAALKECLAVGADKAFLLSDRLFGGSDTFATSYILSRAVAKLQRDQGPFDLIFCGKQAIDGDTAQVGPELAEHLNLPQATYVVDVVENKDDEILIKRETDSGYEIIAAKKPAVLTVTKTSFEPRYPTVKSKLGANRAEIPTITAADLEIDLAYAGLKGSPTKVKKTFTPKISKESVRIAGESPSDVALRLAELLAGVGVV
jgi:electron transfer flavoprotein beta subunit